MNSNLELDNYQVFSNGEGKTIMSIKPKMFGEKEKFSTGMNFRSKNLNLTTRGIFKTENESKNEFIFTTSSLPDVSKISKIKHHTNKSQIIDKDKFVTVLEEKLRLRDLTIKNLEKKLKTKELDESPLILTDLSDLIVELNFYVEHEMSSTNNWEESNEIRKNLVKILSSINDNLGHVKKNQEYLITRDRQSYLDMKDELEKCKEKEVIYKQRLEKFSVEISLLEKENIDLKNMRKIERVKKVIEANSDSFLARENADLKRRLEISCNFLLKKKEKIEKLNEKINSLNKKLNDILKSRTFSENEEHKINEKIMKKIKNESHPISNLNTGSNFYDADYEKRTIDFRTEKLKEKYRDLIHEISENGTGEFVKHFLGSEKEEQERLIEFICDQMLSSMDFSKRLNKMCSFFIDSPNFSSEEFIVYIRLKFLEIFDAERVTLWIFDQYLNEFYTMANFQKHSVSGNDSYMMNVLNQGIYNKYMDNLIVEQSPIYSSNIEKIFVSNNATKSVLAIPIVDSSNDQVYGILEAINSHNLIFGYDEEYLIYIVSNYIKYFLNKFSKEEAENKHNTRETIYSSIIKVMLQKDISSLCYMFQREMKSLIDAVEVKIILVDFKDESFIFYSKDKELKRCPTAGIAGATYKSRTGVFCKYPNVDDTYNPIVDIECETLNSSFYSIPLRREPHGIFAVLQFSNELSDSTDLQYKSSSSNQISKLDYFREKIIEVMSVSFQNALNNIDPQYFKI